MVFVSTTKFSKQLLKGIHNTDYVSVLFYNGKYIT